MGYSFATKTNKRSKIVKHVIAIFVFIVLFTSSWYFGTQILEDEISRNSLPLGLHFVGTFLGLLIWVVILAMGGLLSSLYQEIIK